MFTAISNRSSDKGNTFKYHRPIKLSMSVKTIIIKQLCHNHLRWTFPGNTRCSNVIRNWIKLNSWQSNFKQVSWYRTSTTQEMLWMSEANTVTVWSFKDSHLSRFHFLWFLLKFLLFWVVIIFKYSLPDISKIHAYVSVKSFY